MTYPDMHKKVMFANPHSSCVWRRGGTGRSVYKNTLFAMKEMKDLDLYIILMFTNLLLALGYGKGQFSKTFCARNCI